jgi:hypothetical protein
MLLIVRITKIKLDEPCFIHHAGMHFKLTYLPVKKSLRFFALHALHGKHAFFLFLVFHLALVNQNFIGNPCYLMIDFCDMVG